MLRAVVYCVLFLGALLGTDRARATPPCVPQTIEAQIEAGALPDFSGCPVKYAVSRIEGAFPNQFKVRPVATTNVEGFSPGTVSAQKRQGNLVILIYAAASKISAAALAQVPGGVPGVAPVQHAIFSIADAAPVPAGKPLSFKITRANNDKRAHQINLYYSGDGILVDPPASITFEVDDPDEKDVSVPTSPNQSSTADHQVRITMRPGSDGGVVTSPSAVGTITAPPPAEPPSGAPKEEPVRYAIQSLGAVTRGNDLRFTVSRTGPLGTVRIPYDFTQEGTATAMSEANPPAVEFREGEAATTLVIPSGQYANCGGNVTVTLAGGTSAQGSFSDRPPQDCYPPPPWWEVALDWMSRNLVLTLALAAAVLIGSALGLARIFRPVPKVGSSCTIVPGKASLRPIGQPLSHWPEIRAEAELKDGRLSVTQPLPKLEPADG